MKSERLVDFLYTLMRDEVVCGRVEEIVQNHVEARDRHRLCNGITYEPMADDEACIFTNKGLEMYARELAERILGGS